ncbi:MAG: LacI family DNA-binding transcriptional regulator [Acidobacteria bacterium]|nr:LacI family DNA-binding transcriptional regulator [Acidobacteriota bacterium]
MGYKPNQLARAPSTGKSNLIGVIVPNSSDHYYAEVIRAIEDSASSANYHAYARQRILQNERCIDCVRDMLGLILEALLPPLHLPLKA